MLLQFELFSFFTPHICFTVKDSESFPWFSLFVVTEPGWSVKLEDSHWLLRTTLKFWRYRPIPNLPFYFVGENSFKIAKILRDFGTCFDVQLMSQFYNDICLQFRISPFLLGQPLTFSSVGNWRRQRYCKMQFSK